MKKIFCPKCDTPIPLTRQRIDEMRAKGEERISLVCPQCARQATQQAEKPALGSLTVIENVFAHKQTFPLFLGDNHIGRRNKDTKTDIPIVTADPSMDRHHAMLRISEGKTGRLRFALSDDDSHVGTFVGGRILEPREWCYLESGDVITLGATSIIFSDAAPADELF